MGIKSYKFVREKTTFQELFLLNLLLTKKIGHPNNEEYAIGAVSLTDTYIMSNENVPENYIKLETERIRKKLR